MRNTLRVFSRLLIGAFFLWHVTAVGIYAIPRMSNDPAMLWLREKGSQISRPYLLLLGQWQEWNLFSPDPLRRVPHYVIERQQGEVWYPLKVIDSSTFGLRNHAVFAKLYINLLEQDFGAYNPDLAAHITRSFCVSLQQPSGAALRIHAQGYIIEQAPNALASMKAAPKERREVYMLPGIPIVCP